MNLATLTYWGYCHNLNICVSVSHSVDLSEFLIPYDYMYGFHIVCFKTDMNCYRCTLIFDIFSYRLRLHWFDGLFCNSVSYYFPCDI